MSKVLACDLDGTLLYPKPFKTIIPKKNVKFIQRWIDSGNRFVVVTSRGKHFMDWLSNEIQRPFDYVACTSSLICIDGKIVKDTPMDNKKLHAIVKKINDKYHPLAFVATSEPNPLVIRNNSVTGWFLMFLYKLFWYSQRKAREPYLLSNSEFDRQIEKEKIYKVIVFFGLGRNKKTLSKNINNDLRETFEDIESSWSSIVNELTPKNCNKGSGLEFYCKYLNIKHEDVYVVGDSGNDITMFKPFYENAYVMKKASASVKKYAKNTISKVYKLEKILLKEKKDNE